GVGAEVIRPGVRRVHPPHQARDDPRHLITRTGSVVVRPKALGQSAGCFSWRPRVTASYRLAMSTRPPVLGFHAFDWREALRIKVRPTPQRMNPRATPAISKERTAIPATARRSSLRVTSARRQA